MTTRTDDSTLDRTDTKSEDYWHWRAHFAREFEAERRQDALGDSAVVDERAQTREDHLLSVAYRGRTPTAAPDLEKARQAFSEASRNAWKR
jgi:hypothetical protein